MKIRKISLENLNSLVGQHELDLTAEPIGSAGIFAITGPTGAGKSTLLDAITLALYGRAARYDRPNPEDMMSRHQGKCRAEVEFEVKGEIYRAEWTRHRAREKADGKMQPAKRFIYDANGEVLTQSLHEADEKVEEICGLSYERFMRSALLAQGEFAKFLKSKEDERAELLESLTGTEVFSALSERVFAETSQRIRELEDEEKALGTIAPMEPDVRKAKEVALKEFEHDRTKVQGAVKTLGGALVKADELAQDLKSISAVDKELSDLDTEKKANRTGLEQLEQHRKAEPFFPFLARVDDTRADVASLEKQLVASSTQREHAQSRLEVGVASAAARLRFWVDSREKALRKLKLDVANAGERSRTLDAWLKAHRSDATLKAALPELFEKIETLKHQRGAWSETHKKIVELQAETKAALEASEARQKNLAEAKSRLQVVVGDQAKFAKQLEELSAGKDEGARRVSIDRLGNLLGLREKLDLGEAVVKAERARLVPQKEKAEAAVKSRRAATELFEAHEAHLQTERLRANLEAHRADLKEGEACPLCGSLEHPLKDSHLNQAKADSLKEQAEKAKRALSEAEKTEREEARALAELEAKIGAGKDARESRSAEFRDGCSQLGIEPLGLDELKPLLDRWKKDLASVAEAQGSLEKTKAQVELGQRLVDKLEVEQQSSKELASKLDRQLAQEQAARTKAVRAGEQAIGRLEMMLDPFSELIPLAGREIELRKSLEERAKLFSQKELGLAEVLELAKSAGAREEEIVRELGELKERLAAMDLPDRPVDPEEWHVETMAQLNSKLAALDSAATSAVAAAVEREKQVSAVKLELGTREDALIAKLEGSEFADADVLRALRLEEDALRDLGALEKRLSQEADRLKGRREGLAESLKRLRDDEIPEGEVLAAMRIDHQGFEKRSEVLAQEMATLRAALSSDDQNREAVKSRGAKLGALREELKHWQRLNGLIGSADGKKFRRFAQGISLDVLLRHANVHLERLNDRYQLARREGEELGLEIVDLYQASVTRPMSSLSGGESFLASLALALGLSDLAGRNVQIDSLFIDEGFGSLDGDTLDEAISALEALRLRDKTVGVISHVELLKERISTQVVVGQDSGGLGKIEVVG